MGGAAWRSVLKLIGPQRGGVTIRKFHVLISVRNQSSEHLFHLLSTSTAKILQVTLRQMIALTDYICVNFVAKLIHIGSHYSVCPKYSVSCPNLRCSDLHIKRKDLNDHLKVCPEE